METARKRTAIRTFWAYMAVFWVVLLAIAFVQAHQLGRGLGINDGKLNPLGQRYENGRFDGVKAVGR